MAQKKCSSNADDKKFFLYFKSFRFEFSFVFDKTLIFKRHYLLSYLSLCKTTCNNISFENILFDVVLRNDNILTTTTRLSSFTDSQVAN